MQPVILTVSFVYMHEPDPSFWALPVQVELRAEVVIDAAGDPEVTPIDKAVWQDALGAETVFGGVESPAWIGAKEAAADAACERLSQQATRESAAMAEAS